MVETTSLRYTTPFIVYGTDTPSYLSGEIWPYDPYSERRHSTYAGRGPEGLLPQHDGAMETRGSLIVISGGYLGLSEGMAEAQHGELMMWMHGCRDMQYGLGDRFCEKALAAMINPESRVTMVRYAATTDAYEDLVNVRAAGFDVTETGDAAPGTDGVYAVCAGTGYMLGKYEWLACVRGYEPFYFHANRGPLSRIELDIMDAARRGGDPELAAVRCLEEAQRHPEAAEEILGQDHMRIAHTDPEQESLLVARQDPDISGVRGLFLRAAQGVGIALFDAGNLRHPNSDGSHFTEFRSWDECAPVPALWKRVL